MADNRVSHVHITTVIADTGDTRVSHLHTTTVLADTSSTARLSHLHLTTVVNQSVDFAWCDVFYEIQFPTFVRFTSEGGPGFEVLQQRTTAGRVQRVGLWDENLKTFNLSMQRGATDIATVADFFDVVGGPEIGFRLKDHRDYSTATFVDNVPGTITNADMALGTGDDTTAAHQLYVTKSYDGQSRTKTIYKPVSSTILIAQDASTVTNYTLDDTTGVVTWTPRTSVTGTDISFVDIGAGDWVIRSTSTSWANFVTGEEIRVSGSTSNDTSVPDGTYTITGSVPAGAGDLDIIGTLVSEGTGASITVDVHPYPRTGVVLTWGGEWDTPVHLVDGTLAIRYVEGEDGTIQNVSAQFEELRQVDTLG